MVYSHRFYSPSCDSLVIIQVKSQGKNWASQMTISDHKGQVHTTIDAYIVQRILWVS